MKRYFYLQLKRVSKILPFVFLITSLLLSGIMLILSGVIENYGNSEENQAFKIAITGDTDSEYIKWGMTAMQTFDETRFSMEFVNMSEAEAEAELSRGGISAYVVLPEDFVDKAMYGDLDPIKYVTTPGNGGLVSMFKNEITKLVTDMVVYSEKGSYGLSDAMIDNGLRSTSNKYMNLLSIEYVDLIFSRSDVYEVNELGISAGLDMGSYFVCSVTILLIMLIGLPFVTILTKRDYSLDRLLMSRGRTDLARLMSEYLAHLISMLALTGVICLLAGIFIRLMPDTIGLFLTTEQLLAFGIRLLPVVILLSAFNVMIFTLADNIVSGVLVHFFTTMGLCYITGCMYPIYAFPKAVQKVSVFLPTGVMRSYLSGAFTDEPMLLELIGVLGFAVLFFVVTLMVRRYKTANRRGG